MPTPHLEPQVHTGTLDGAEYRVEMPAQWNGTLLLYSHHYRQPGLPCPALAVPSDDELGPRLDGGALRGLLHERGYALAGTARTTGWMMEDTLRDQVLLHDWFMADVGRPERTYVWGASPGGLASITLAQLHPRRFDGALSLSADASGVINQMLLRLDMGHVVNTLLAPEHDLELGLISDPQGNFDKANAIIAGAARGDALSRARLILSGAVASIEPLVDGHTDRPVTDPEKAAEQLVWVLIMAHSSILFGPARKEMEERAGGNPIWNDDVDYRALYARTTPALRELTEHAYREAGADLDADLAALDAAPRVSADIPARNYLVRTAGFPGLTPVPVVTVHNTLDGPTPVGHERSLADRVALVGDPGNLRQLFVDRGFTCGLSPAEIMTALDVLEHRVATGEWGDTTAETLNAAAGKYSDAHRRVYNFWIPQEREDERYAPLAPAFTEFTPLPLPRSYPF
ncbi:alpha/beta hydrolase family protein [Streptomyces sp. NPDC059010]|uniref:alpha/beta hydrolase family protein n=1 Tax=Streptomyces sp. NPDC059010 TaxID=3346695 RepID=UPI0036A3C1D3